MATPEQVLSVAFKHTFADENGKRVLDNLRLFCRAIDTMGLYDPHSDRQTAYNLGAHSVWRYIKTQIDMKFEENADEDCQANQPKQENVL